MYNIFINDMGYSEYYKKQEQKMNLGKKYKQLFEGKTRSDDSNLVEGKLTEGRGVMNNIKDAVEELMFDSNISEKEAVMELVTAISDEYDFDVKIKE